jgi:tetratricopeptide (TPR) repeat protein
LVEYFDFSGHGLLDRYRVVYIIEPDGKIPYVTISWPGPMPWNYRGVHTAMNAHGLSLGYMISQAPGETNRGTPALWALFREVVESAATIDEAVALLKASSRTAAANLLLADGKTPDAVVVEMTSRALVVRRAQDGVVYSTNHFASVELLNPEYKDSDSLARFERLGALAAKGYGAFDLAHAVSAMRDRWDVHTDAETPEGDVIGGPVNMLSVIFHPADLKFWVATGDAPAAYRQFIGFDLRLELEGVQAGAVVPSLPADMSLDADTWSEIEAYQSARRAYSQGDDASAVQHFVEAVSHNPDSPRYGYGLAGALMNLGRYDEAIEALQVALTGDSQSGYRPYIYYRLGLAYERTGDENGMRQAFEQVLEMDVGDEEIEAYARRALGR